MTMISIRIFRYLSFGQEKGVDLENLFLYAYERLKINMEETAEDKPMMDGDPSFTVVTDVSLPSSMADVDVERDDESFEDNPCPKFSLNLLNIKAEESSDNED